MITMTYGNHLDRSNVAHYSYEESDQETLRAVPISVATERVSAVDSLDLLIGPHTAINIDFEMLDADYQAAIAAGDDASILRAALSEELVEGAEIEGVGTRRAPANVQPDPEVIVVSARIRIGVPLRRLLSKATNA